MMFFRSLCLLVKLIHTLLNNDKMDISTCSFLTCSPASACVPTSPSVPPPVCLLDGPLCHSATNGQCWASHFLNDTLLRSIQLPCSYTLTPLPLLLLPPFHHFLSCTTQWLSSRVDEKQFLANFLSVFSAHVSRWNNLILSNTHSFVHCISPSDWLTLCNWSIFSALIAASSPTEWLVH